MDRNHHFKIPAQPDPDFPIIGLGYAFHTGTPVAVQFIDDNAKGQTIHGGEHSDGVWSQGMVKIEAMRSIPYQRLASRMFSSGACWLSS